VATLSRKERDRQLRRSDILKAAEHLFALKGYNKATIRDIAKEAQYGTGTVYLHFKDKNALYFALFEEKFKSLLSIIEEKVGQAKDAPGKLRAFVRESLAFFEQSCDFFRIFISEDDKLAVESKISRSPTGRQFHEHAVNLIRQAQDEGEISRDFDPGQIGEVFSAIQKTIVLDWFKKDKTERKSLSGLSDIILRYLLKGVGSK
jgi:AcrR family transcriptional regulator